MFTKTRTGYYKSDLLNPFPRVHHGFSTRMHGDMRDRKKRLVLESLVGSILTVRQIHSNEVVIADFQKPDPNTQADALVGKYEAGMSVEKGIGFGILTADCVPMLFYDSKLSIMGAAHAGWKGTLSKIAARVIQTMGSIGSDPENIIVILGPYIHSCCYSVSGDRAELYREEFGHSNTIVVNRDGSEYLDFGSANLSVLISEGVLPGNIDNSSKCTSCHSEEFFSFRKKNGELIGEMMGFIGFSGQV